MLGPFFALVEIRFPPPGLLIPIASDALERTVRLDRISLANRHQSVRHFLGWSPMFHGTDNKIRVHAFYACSR